LGEKLNNSIVSLDSGICLVKLAVHTVGLINEDKSGFVNLFLEFFERVGDACELGFELVKAALSSLIFEDLLD